MADLTHKLLRWYHANKRDLPWRKTHDPYQIWLSEIILQQTRVEQGLPYFMKFVHKFPTAGHLAAATEDEVLRLWQGLGYYTRARNLHRCARMVVEKFNGDFPQTHHELIKLPGIGRYTAAAIASFAFGQKVGVVDGNVIRVVARVMGVAGDVSERSTLKKIENIIDRWIPAGEPGLFNQAIMEFGALQCVPSSPACNQCIFMIECHAYKHNLQECLPEKRKKIKKRTRYFHYLVIEIDSKFLLHKRTGKDIWHGLFEYFLIESPHDASFDQIEIPHELLPISHEWALRDISPASRHILTHQTIIAKFYHINCKKACENRIKSMKGYDLYSAHEIENLPKSILTERYFAGRIK